jgi:hypothetical protein
MEKTNDDIKIRKFFNDTDLLSSNWEDATINAAGIAISFV